ncbi:PSD1 and planctomycete cytochrome C domain-containing protein [Rubripirellula amarantea]|nr:PSD1 and planctomycete cytochrome C domain-containing protein [Rubripirellula amarantea]
MTKSLSCVLLFLLVGAVSYLWTGEVSAVEQSAVEPSEVDREFTLKVLPLLKEKCFGCHGSDPDDLRGDFDMRSRESLLRGGETEEPSIVPGDADESVLVQSIRWEYNEMPPKENDRLTADQIQLVEGWINAGAPWPDDETRAKIVLEQRDVQLNEDGMLISTSGGLSDEWSYRRYEPESIWAFMPLQRPNIALDTLAGSDASASGNSDDKTESPIDFFINRQLTDAGLTAVGQAHPRMLVRRAYHDLIGLPPTPIQIEQFLAAWNHDPDLAWSRLVDELLESPHYGERWAQHWLDVVRYADTGGMANDYERSNAWRYRDYVINAFNDDKPYDQFIREQLAGDEIAFDETADDEITDSSLRSERIVATGFLRMGPFDTAMVAQDEARQIYRDDLVHNIGQSFLSMPMRCCKCHDHKFDPVPTRDYYRFYAALAATQPAEIPTPFSNRENTAGFEEGSKLVESLYGYAKKRVEILEKKREDAARAWYKEHGLEYKNLEDRKQDKDEDKPIRAVGLTESEQGELKVREQDVWIWNRRRERFLPMAQSVYNGPDRAQNARKLLWPENQPEKKKNWKPESFIFIGGSLSSKGEEVTPGVLSGCGLAVEGSPTSDPYALPTTISGRRLALANWIADPRNPLTARSFVNRIWQHHFGHGLVRTPNNFGVKGDSPSHPELLDWLASEFIDGGMTTKRMHRMIMMSDVYLRSAENHEPEKTATVDPDNRLLSYFHSRRLTAEEIRDSMLMVSGELNLNLGGLPARPEINMEVALEPRMIQFSLAPAYLPSPTPAERNRRSIYAYRVRGQADPFMEVMNKPGPNESCDLRDDAAVSPQAFTLINSDVVSDRSLALAIRLASQSNRREDQVALAFELTLGRKPTSDEMTRLTAYVSEMADYHADVQPTPVSYPTEITRSLVEEFTGEPFQYTEWLPVFENYVADTKPDQVDAPTRALADLCLLLFNTHEFIYVY